jgi:hypothetical protein
MRKSLMVAAAVLSLAAGVSQHALARPLDGRMHSGPDGGQTVMTGRSQVVTTGHVGNTYTTTLPGGGEGLLTNNGNGTSTLVGPGTTMTVPTPR